MIFRPADFINENAGGFATSMNEVMVKPILDLRREDRLIVFGMPSEMQIDLMIRMDRHDTCPFRNQIGPVRCARAFAVMGGYDRRREFRWQAPSRGGQFVEEAFLGKRSPIIEAADQRRETRIQSDPRLSALICGEALPHFEFPLPQIFDLVA
jgi:hypothetical protein